jgi:hypothetical protein
MKRIIHSIITVAMLAGASLFQTVRPETVPTQRNVVDAKEHVAAKQKTLSVNWEVQIPFVGCENGTPVLNVEIPDVNAPTAVCQGVQPPDVLPDNAPATASAAQDGAYEVGTVIVMSVSHDKIVLASDSRNARITTRTLPDGTVERKIKYDDCACKLIQLTPRILFAADGQVWAGSTIPTTALYDAHELARLAARNYHSSSQEEQLASGALAAIATRWAWDVDFRMHHGFANHWTPFQTLEGIFAGLEKNGEIGLAVARLEYPKPRSGLRVPPVAFTIGALKSPPTDFTWVEAFGMKDVAETYYSARAATEQTKAENKRISSEILKKPTLFSPMIPERLVELTIRHYKAAAGREGPLFVHGPVDVASLERKQEINWIHWKNCSGAKRPAHSRKPKNSSPNK